MDTLRGRLEKIRANRRAFLEDPLVESNLEGSWHEPRFGEADAHRLPASSTETRYARRYAVVGSILLLLLVGGFEAYVHFHHREPSIAQIIDRCDRDPNCGRAHAPAP